MDSATNSAMLVATTLLSTYSSKPDSEIMKTLDNICYNIFGRFNLYTDKKKALHDLERQEFFKSISQKVDIIPEKNLMEPHLSIIGPALESAKYYVEEKTLREMFANLVASSVNSEKISYVHPSFVEIIKQLSPLDAQNLSILSKRGRLPIAKFVMGTFPIVEHVFLSNEECDDIILQSASITNLNRLGLVKIDYDYALEEQYYQAFLNQADFIRLKTSGEFFDHPIASTGDLQKGSLDLTNFGDYFVETCLPRACSQ